MRGPEGAVPVKAEPARTEQEGEVDDRKEEERQSPGERRGSAGSGIISLCEVRRFQSHQVESEDEEQDPSCSQMEESLAK